MATPARKRPKIGATNAATNVDVGPSMFDMGNVNTALLNEVDQSIDLVVNSIPELATDMEPMKSEFTLLPPFDQKHFEKCMKATGEYKCAGSYWLLDLKKTAAKERATI